MPSEYAGDLVNKMNFLFIDRGSWLHFRSLPVVSDHLRREDEVNTSTMTIVKVSLVVAVLNLYCFAVWKYDVYVPLHFLLAEFNIERFCVVSVHSIFLSDKNCSTTIS